MGENENVWEYLLKCELKTLFGVVCSIESEIIVICIEIDGL